MDRSLYEEHATLERDQWWFVARRQIIREVIARRLGTDPGRTILDVGCGTGGMLTMLATFGSVRGIEGDQLAVQQAGESFPDLDVSVGRIPDDIPRDGSHDIVTAFDVIEHIEDDVSALRAMVAAAKPVGSLVLTVPAMPWLWSTHDDLNGHHRRYTRRTLMTAISAAGARTVHLSYFNTVLMPMVVAVRAAQRIRPRPVEPSSDFSMPSRPVNRALTRAMGAERGLVAGPGLPVGVSLIAIARPS